VLLEGVEREPGEALLFGTEERRSDGANGSGGEGGKTEIWATAKGPSAGQSTMMLVFDTFLGVEHGGKAKARGSWQIATICCWCLK